MPVSTESKDRPASSGILRSWGRTLSDKDDACSTPGSSTYKDKDREITKDLVQAKASLEGRLATRDDKDNENIMPPKLK